jgi:asparagine synthase (glutamine-hydrolysing)
MCGIAGFIASESVSIPAVREQVFAALAHRGPDGNGYFAADGIELLHTRLSIIDLSQGAQPLRDAHGHCALVANGEIYNFVELREALQKQGAQFQTHSDCEVILQGFLLEGQTFFAKLEGMFAFALHDTRDGKTYLARDALGMKPLFYSQSNQGVAFASEIKALLPYGVQPAAVDPVGLLQYLEMQHSTGERTAMAGVQRLPAGVCWVYQCGQKVAASTLWSLQDEPVDSGLAPTVADLDALMEIVITQHLRSDVPIGLFLSGGVDSTILLALMRRYGIDDIKTFSVGFPGSSVGDELAVAGSLAKHFSAEHHIVTPSADDMLGRFVETVWAADDLMRDPANLPSLLLAELASKDVKVVLSGEGGDEAFAGYGRYRMGRVEQMLKACLFPGTGGFRTRGDFRHGLAKALWGTDLMACKGEWRAPWSESWAAMPSSWTLLQKMQALDSEHALPNNLLVKADRMLMAYGVEGRTPFVDRRVMSFGVHLPDHCKLRGGSGKAILKEWAAGFMPTEHFGTRKRGFKVPLNDWLRGPELERWHRCLIHNEALRTWFAVAGIDTLFQRQRRKGDVAKLILALTQFAIWHKLFIEGDGARPPAHIHPIEYLMEAS